MPADIKAEKAYWERIKAVSAMLTKENRYVKNIKDYPYIYDGMAERIVQAVEGYECARCTEFADNAWVKS